MLRALLILLVITDVWCAHKLPGLGNVIGFDIRLDNMQSCPDIPDAVIIMEDLSLEQFNRTMLTANGKFRVTDTVKSLKVIFDLTKCDSKQQTDSCQHFISIVVKDGCAKLEKRDEPWSPFFAHIIAFLAECPLKPGTYDIQNAPINVDFLAENPLIFGYWKALETVMEGEKLISCTEITFHLVKSRSKLPGRE